MSARDWSVCPVPSANVGEIQHNEKLGRLGYLGQYKFGEFEGMFCNSLAAAPAITLSTGIFRFSLRGAATL